MLARQQGFVYYEADCFAVIKNPYVPLDSEAWVYNVYSSESEGGILKAESYVIILSFRGLFLPRYK